MTDLLTNTNSFSMCVLECSFIKVFDRSDGLAVRCQPGMGISEKTQDSCLQEACNIATGGQDEYNAVNIM